MSNKKKCHFVFLFSSTELENRKVEDVFSQGRGWRGTSGSREVAGKVDRRVNT
jgi:hypothetical protein